VFDLVFGINCRLVKLEFGRVVVWSTCRFVHLSFGRVGFGRPDGSRVVSGRVVGLPTKMAVLKSG
jgi:hypothetical protein